MSSSIDVAANNATWGAHLPRHGAWFESQLCSQFQPAVNVHPGRQQGRVQYIRHPSAPAWPCPLAPAWPCHHYSKHLGGISQWMGTLCFSTFQIQSINLKVNTRVVLTIELCKKDTHTHTNTKWSPVLVPHKQQQQQHYTITKVTINHHVTMATISTNTPSIISSLILTITTIAFITTTAVTSMDTAVQFCLHQGCPRRTQKSRKYRI